VAESSCCLDPAKNYLAPETPKPAASAPTNHEIGGYMPGRGEFEPEAEEDAEQYVKDMLFEDTDTPDETGMLALPTTCQCSLFPRAETSHT